MRADLPPLTLPMPGHRYLMRGVYVALGMLLLSLIVYIVQVGLSYDGKCGGFFPGLSARKSCSFLDYVSGEAVAVAMIMVVALWPIALAVLALPPLVGHWLDRRNRIRSE